IDPDYATLMDWKIDKPEPMWIEQLNTGTNIVQKIKAAQALGKKATPKALEALGNALTEDSFWGVQLEVAKVLGSVKNESSLDQLLTGVNVKSTRARTGVARALGEFYKNDRAFKALKKLMKDKESYFVAAAAATSVGKSKHDSAFKTLRAGLKIAPPSWHYLVQQGYLAGLAATEKEEAIAVLREYMVLGTPDELRRVVPGHLAKLGKRYKKKHPEIGSDIEKMLNDRSFRVQVYAIIAAKTLEDAALIPVLQKLAESEVGAGVIRRARLAVRALSKKKEPKEIDSLRKSIEELEKENRDLKDRLSKVEAFVGVEKKAEDE
ncbi:MAG: HEAT repeat domain-containing protein, partial [Candidatus Thorarchaeota archaeon]